MTPKRLGAFTIARVEELLGHGFKPDFLFPDWDPAVIEEHRDWMVPGFVDVAADRFISSIHSWVIRTAHHTIVVDTCAGNHKNRPGMERFHMLDTPYLARLRAAGVEPAEVDYVLCTHLHVDHAGWNTQLVDGRWAPTFPNAKYIFSRAEHDGIRDATGTQSGYRNVYEDSVVPVMEAGQGLLVEGAHAIEDGLRIEPAPGHTGGSVVLWAESAGERAAFSGDIMHQPIQVYRPEWNSCFCELPEEARRTRRRVLQTCSEQNALLLPAHFAPPHAGRIRARGDGFAIALGW
ncbi:MAG: MBL fold metallo-hydrolase [Betaproteobacteria bacterium]|nr:MBL fold metallo-hydrolase [Betaproteobacteria bacterium]